MNQAEVSGLLCVGLHQTDAGDESYAAECLKMNQDSSHVTTKFDVVLSASTMHSDQNDAGACVDEYQHTRMMTGFQPVDEVGFGSTQHFDLQSQGIVPDSEEESLPSSPETSSATNYDMPGSVEQHYQHICNAFAEMPKMVDKEGPVMLSPEYVMCGTALHFEPHLTFSSDGFKIEYMDHDCGEDDEMIALYWKNSDIICISCKWTQSVGSVLITLLLVPDAETGNFGQVRVQFCLIDPQWPRKQQNIWHLASRYQEIWNDIPSDDFASENWIIEPSLFFPKQYFTNTEDFEDVIYPKGDHDAVSISKRDVELLLPETFVNDTIIDFYIKHLSTRIELTEKHRYHFFNSFFFRKLADLDKDQGRAPEGRAAFLRVRKWTRKINLFEKDFLFIPVNFNLHWSLIVICFPGEVETFEDGDPNIHAKTPCILHMDSLKGSHSGLKDIIQSYLWEEWKERHPESASDCSEKFLNLRFISLELPQQDNSFDCGLFLLHYVELFLMDAPRSFNPLKIDAFSCFLSDDWFPPAEASMKRSLIRKLIHELLRDPSQNYPKLVCCNEQFDKRHQSSENAEREQAGELPAQMCSAGEPDSVCTILGTQHDTMDPKLWSISDNAELMASEERSLERNNNEVEDENGRASQDIADSVMMLDGSKDDMEPDPESTIGKAEVGKCDLSEDMDFDGSKDDTDPDPESTMGEAELGKCDLYVDMDSVALRDINKDVADRSSDRNIVEAEDMKCEDALVDHITVEDANKYDVKETSTTAETSTSQDEKNELYVSSELKEGSTDNGMTSTVSSEMEKRNIDNVMADGNVNGTDETHADGQDAHNNLVTGETVPCEDNTICITDAEMSLVDSICIVKNEIISDNTTSDAKRPLPDSTYKEDIVVPDDKCSQKDDVQGADVKVELHYKRRKFLGAELNKQHKFTSSRTSSLD